MKTAVLQPVGRKTAKVGYKITNFGTGSINLDFGRYRCAVKSYIYTFL
jgi:hypothetical protein